MLRDDDGDEAEDAAPASQPQSSKGSKRAAVVEEDDDDDEAAAIMAAQRQPFATRQVVAKFVDEGEEEEGLPALPSPNATTSSIGMMRVA